jgi:hypothetical protein
VQDIEAIDDKVRAAWAPYGQLASRLPPELRERHARIYAAQANAQPSSTPSKNPDDDIKY